MTSKSWPNLLRCINHRVCLDTRSLDDIIIGHRKVAFSKPFMTNKNDATLDLKDLLLSDPLSK